MTEARVTFELTLEGAGELQVQSFAAREALSEGFTMSVEALGAEPVDLASVVGKRASLAVLRVDGGARRFHGVVLAATEESPREGVWRVRLEVGARVERLRLGQNCRIFQQKSVPEIVKKVLDDAGLSGDAQSWGVRGSYEPRAYVVQYNESDWDFARRLLAAEGIGFLVRHGESSEQVLFFDDDGAWQPTEGAAATLLDRDATQLSEDVVWDVRERRRGTPDASALRDYDYTRPSLDLTATSAAPRAAGREVYDHPGGFQDLAVGRRLSARALERLRLRGHVVEARSDCAFLEPGRTFSLDRCARAALDADYVVWRCEHEGAAATVEGAPRALYENRVTAIPRATPFRPERDVRAPVSGALVAFVTTPAGEEIHTDAWGRAKVRFPWDRSGLTDDRSSTWLRVGQLALSGSMILPRGGYEVLVDAERDDLDRPFITAHLYNGEARPPYALPGGNTRSSIQSATYHGGGGANELRFEDAAGAEEMFLNASKDLTVSVDHDASWQVNRNETVTVGSNRSLKVGRNRQRAVTSNRSMTVDGDLSLNAKGVYTEVVGGSESLSVGGMRLGKVGGGLLERTTGALSRTVGSLQSVTGLAGVVRSVKGNATNTVGGAWVQMSGGSAVSACKGSRTELVGALKLVKAKSMTVECGAAYTENVAAMSVKAGGSRTDEATGAVTINAGGGLSVKAETITIEAKSRLVVMAGGCVIQLSSSGDVKVKAVSIDLRGAKGINQVMHNSN
ncbi:MAG: type VI secretion system tip protein TssI/VgrG [Polyangiales bacterium]